MNWGDEKSAIKERQGAVGSRELSLKNALQCHWSALGSADTFPKFGSARVQ